MSSSVYNELNLGRENSQSNSTGNQEVKIQQAASASLPFMAFKS